MSEKALPARSIYGWDGTNWVKVKVDADGKVYITNTDLTTLLSEIQNATYGLEALKDAIDAISLGSGASAEEVWEYVARTLTSVPSGSALEATLTAIKGTGWTNETLKVIKDAIDVIDDYVDSEVAAIKAKTDLLFSGIATEAKQDTIIAKTGNLPSDPADESAVEAAITAAHSATETKIERKITHMDFWADNTAQVILTTVATADYALSALTVAGIPVGATLVRVVALLKIAVIRDTSTANNAVNGATALKVDADVAYGSLVTAIDIADNSWAVLVANGADRGGDIMIGDNDVKTEITGNGTFYARLENIACDGNNLSLEDVAWGVRIYFY